MENIRQNESIERAQLDRARKRVKKMAGFYKHLGVYLVINIFVIGSRYLRHKHGDFFTFENFSMALFWGVGLALHGLSVFGPGAVLGQDWEERKIREIMEREKNTSKKWE